MIERPAVDVFELPEPASGHDLAVGERLLAGLLLRHWQAQQGKSDDRALANGA